MAASKVETKAEKWAGSLVDQWVREKVGQWVRERVVSLAASMVGLMAVLWALEWVVWKVD